MNTKSLLLPTTLSLLAHAQAAPPADLVFFRATFDGKATATLNGQPLAPVREEKAAYAASDRSQALVVGAGTQVEYDLGTNFPFQEGAMEIRFKPDFPQQPDQTEREILSLGNAEKGTITFGFHPKGTRWRYGMTFPGWKREMPAHYFGKKDEGQWSHLLMVWNLKGESGPELRLFRSGRGSRGQAEPYKQKFEGLRRLVIGNVEDVRSSIDEIVIYRRALKAEEAEFLPGSFAQEDRILALAQKIEEDAKVVVAQKEARRALVANLQGRVAQLINPRGGTPMDFKLPEGIVAKGVRVEDVGKVDLSQFAVIYGPPGGGYQLTAEQNQIMRDYVQKGGGYVGVCAGANYAGKAKLLNMSTHALKNHGLVSVGIVPHPITQGYQGEVMVHHGNGPIMIPGEGCTMVGSFSIGQKFPVTTAAIVAGNLGQGRAVAFGPHPTGGEVTFQTKGSHFSGAELGTEGLLVNALLWAAKIIDQP